MKTNYSHNGRRVTLFSTQPDYHVPSCRQLSEVSRACDDALAKRGLKKQGGQNLLFWQTVTAIAYEHGLL